MGWIAIDKEIQNHWLWDSGEFDYRSAWFDLLMLAAWKDTKREFRNKLVDVKRGQCLVSIRGLSKRWGWSTKKVITFLGLLRDDGMVNTDVHTGETLVTIVNYDVYQFHGNAQGNTEETLEKRSRNAQETETNNGTRKQYINNIYGDFFETCWQAYPKKKGKGQVSDTKKKYLYDNVGQEQMLRCIERYKAEMADKDQQFMMYGSTFFNSGYVDYLDENYEKSAKDYSYDSEQDKLRKQLLDEYRHLCDVIPGCKDHNNKTMQSRFWQLVKTDDMNKSIRKAQKISVWVSQELQTRDMTLGGLFDELSSRNSGH